MKLYLFNPTEAIDDWFALAVVAESKEQAMAIYRREKLREFGGDGDYTVHEVELKPGLIIGSDGYGHIDLYARMAE